MLSSTYLLFRFQSQHFLLHYRHEKSFIFYWNSFLLSSSVFFKCCWYTGKSPCSDLSGPYGLVKWMEKFETESIFFGRPFDDSARVQQNCANPVAALKNQYYTLGYIHFQNDSINSYLYEHCGLSMNIMDYLWTLWIIMMIDINLKRFLTIVKVWILELSLKKKSIGTSKTFMTCGFTFSTTENYSFLLIIIWKHNEKMWRHLTYFKFQAYNRLLEFSASQSMDKVHYTVQVGNVKSNC